jgi:hypothetical protein
VTRRELWDLGVPPVLHQLADGHQEVDVADLGLLGQRGDEGLESVLSIKSRLTQDMAPTFCPSSKVSADYMSADDQAQPDSQSDRHDNRTSK